ncbi:MAG: hypothetical protein QF515_03650 [Pseudomonadales bacterium]|jgi:hypothetical protein|nr:hypothetical protein [Pseudomonadales bacterium]MDP6473041.1 hypothetical protein [Pseudomonadales bacterium]MDP6826202.1 hypothetical protein [Pseudomonadales bacterium]|tara:strand:- start:68 stop:529 length:462 start_codon:yes stop_codon:yes gene_type:complete
MNIRATSTFLFLFVLPLFAMTESWAVTLEQEMSRSEFEAAGLNKLSEKELARLNAYLGRQPADQTQEFGAEQLKKEKRVEEVQRIDARIKGAFDGWDGHTYFRLDNGQVWQQRLASTYRHHSINPEVIIEKGRFGYYLRLKDGKRKVAVNRIH